MRLGDYFFIFIVLICFVALSCAQHAIKEISPAQTWAMAEANATEATATSVAEFVAGELSLGPKQTKKFVNDYVAERETAAKRQMAQLEPAAKRT